LVEERGGQLGARIERGQAGQHRVEIDVG